MGTGWGTVMEGQRLSHAGSHRVAWGKTHTVPVLPKPPAWAMGEITEKQAKGVALVDKGIRQRQVVTQGRGESELPG